MEAHVEKLQAIANAYEKRPAWDKLGENDPSNRNSVDLGQYLNDENAPRKSGAAAFWMTTNGEYGRYYILRQKMAAAAKGNAGRIPSAGELSRSLELLGIRPPSGRDPGASARSRAESVAREEAARTGSRADSIARPQGTSLPERRLRYMPLRGYQPEKADLEPERRKLTTGYAKGYMQTSHPRFYDNVKQEAPGAGFSPNSRPATNAEILTVDYQNNGDFCDGALQEEATGEFDYTKYLSENFDDNRQTLETPGSSRSRQQGY